MLKQIPNILTFSRGLALVLVLFCEPLDSMKGAIWAFLLVVYGSISDFLDGWLSRKFNWVSDFGKLADAFLDKVFVIGLYIYLIILNVLPEWAWWIIGMTLIRDQVVNYLRAKGAATGLVFPASKVGKIKTTCQMTSLIGMYFLPILQNLPDFKYLPLCIDIFYYSFLAVFVAAAYLTFSSGVFYVRNYVPAIRQAKSKKESV